MQIPSAMNNVLIKKYVQKKNYLVLGAEIVLLVLLVVL